MMNFYYWHISALDFRRMAFDLAEQNKFSDTFNINQNMGGGRGITRSWNTSPLHHSVCQSRRLSQGPNFFHRENVLVIFDHLKTAIEKFGTQKFSIQATQIYIIVSRPNPQKVLRKSFDGIGCEKQCFALRSLPLGWTLRSTRLTYYGRNWIDVGAETRHAYDASPLYKCDEWRSA